MRRIINPLLFLVALTTVAISCSKTSEKLNPVLEDSSSKETELPDSSLKKVDLAGNAFITVKPSGATEEISSSGLSKWTNAEAISSVYFRVSKAGRLFVKIRAKLASAADSSRIKVTINGSSKEVKVTTSDFATYTAGYFDAQAGYVKVDLQGISKSGRYFAEVPQLLIGGPATTGEVLYSNDPSMYYWARRGPSCHLRYSIPTKEAIQYYYGEVTVPVGEDKIGSYFMSNGFDEGYFGIQVNSETERRILFSLWSPYKTDDPKSIPEDMKIVLNKKGDDVYIGEFGNEGSGGQSYLRYNWKAGTTYKFLLKGQPDGKGATDYTAWIHLQDKGGWFLIASWKRPVTSKNLTGFHSFLENFEKDNGYLGRKVSFSNRWVRTVDGVWLPINEAQFTVDETYNKKQRIDALGGIENNQFYLQNGGFFSTIVAPGTKFSITAPSVKPDIDFDSLP